MEKASIKIAFVTVSDQKKHPDRYDRGAREID